MLTCRRMQIDPYLSAVFKTQVQVDQQLNIDPITLNLIEEKVGSSLELFGTGDHFLSITPVAQTLRLTINNWNLQKLKIFYRAKDTVNKTKWQPTEREKIFTKPTSDRGFIYKIYNELKKLNIKIPNNQLKMRYIYKQRIQNRRISND